MRAIRILFAIFSFSIFSYDLQLRSSDLFRFSAADLGGLDDHRDCGRIVLDGLVAHFLGLLPHGLASAFAALHGLAEVLGTTADGHVSAGIEQLLGNGTDAAVFLELAGEAALERVVGAAVGLALRAVAATLGGVRFEHGRGGVLAGAGIGVAELCRLADCVKAFEVAVCTPEIIAGDGDFGIAHAVTDEQDDVLGGAVADGRNALCAAVLSQFRNGLAVQIVSGSFVGERRCRKRAERCNGSDCCNRSFESLSIAHLFFFFLQPVLYCNLHARFRKPTSEAFWTNKT